MNFLNKTKEYIEKHYKRFIGCFIYGILIMIINNSFKDSFDSLIEYSNGAYIAGMTLVLFGLLVAISNTGTLDIFGYTFSGRKVNGHKESLYDYSERKKVERKPFRLFFIDYIIIGALFIAISLILLLLI